MKKASWFSYRKALLLLLFTGGFSAGIVWVSLGREGWLLAALQLEPDFLWKIEQISVDKRALFFLTAGKRLSAFFLLWLLSYSLFGRAAVLGYFGYSGLCAGSVLELLMIKYGLKGLVFYFGLIFPQIIFYIPSYILVGNFCLKRANGSTGEGRTIKKPFASGLWLGLGTLLIGIFLESYVNPEGIKILVKFLLH